MTTRLPISVEEPLWRDGQQVSVADVEAAQSNKQQMDAAVLNNFFGSGLIPYVPERQYLFDSNVLTAIQSQLVASNNFDGYGISPSAQPVDASLGAQLEIELSGSAVKGRQQVHVLVVGLDFNSVLQCEKFTFRRNEVQVGTKHFKSILTMLFDNFKGNSNCSRILGGRITIRETLPMQLSRSTLMSSQNVEPDIFFRDFKVYDLVSWPNVTVALKQTIQNAIGPSYSVSALNITQTWLNKRSIAADDITTIYGQKFKATSDNIQKITLLLGVEKDVAQPAAGWFSWSGDIVVSVYVLQSSVSCITDIVPSNAIGFPPESTPVAQLSISQAELMTRGYVLNNVEQPVDFTFTDARIGGNVNSGISEDSFYMVTLQRAGAAGTGSLFTMTGGNRTEDARFSFYNGVGWTDVADEDMWYEIWSDAVKASDGMGIDAGNGMYVPKTMTDSATGVIEDYSLQNISLINNGTNTLNHTIAQAITEQSDTVQDPRTGNPVFSRQIYKASVSNTSSATLISLRESSDPVVLGCAYDTNTKSDINIDGYQYVMGLADGDVFCIVAPDANLLGVNLIGSRFTPNTSNGTAQYRIFNTELCIDGYGDVNGDGYIDNADVARAAQLIGHSLWSPLTQAMIAAGTINPLEIIRADVDGDGYVTSADVQLINNYVRHDITSFPAGYTFNRLCLHVAHNTGRNDGYYDCSDTQIRVNPYSTAKILISGISATELEYYGRPDPVLIESDPVFTSVPFSIVPFRIVNDNDSWSEELVKTANKGRMVPCTFTYNDDVASNQCTWDKEFECEDRFGNPSSCEGGRNDFFIPDNLVMGRGQIIDTAGDLWPVDIEMTTVTFELSQTAYSSGSIDIFRLFVADKGNGFTVANYPAMKFADCSFVGTGALQANQVKFATAIKSYSPNIDGYADGYSDGYDGYGDGYGFIVDPVICVDMNHSTGVMYFRAANLNTDPVNTILRTRIEVTVYLKKAGWRNPATEISYTEFDGLVGL